jgi:hypothetical protein
MTRPSTRGLTTTSVNRRTEREQFKHYFETMNNQVEETTTKAKFIINPK